MVTLTNHVIPGPDLHCEAPGTMRIFATSSSQISIKTKKRPAILAWRPGTVSYGKSGPGYCSTIIKTLDEGLR